MTRDRSNHFTLLPVLAAAFLVFVAGGSAATGTPSVVGRPSVKAESGVGEWGRSHGPEGGSVAAITIDPRRPAIVYAGTVLGGLFKSSDGGATWHALRVDPAGVIRGALALDPRRTATVYLGTGRGVFKSTYGGRSWGFASAGLFAKETPQERAWRLAEGWVTEFAIDPRNSKTLYASTYGGVAKSTDGGRRWRRVNAGLTVRVAGKRTLPRPLWAVVLDPKNSRTVYASGLRGVFKSTTGGRRWRRAGPFRRDAWALALDPKNLQTLYAGTSRGVFKTGDGGRSWGAVGLPGSSVSSIALEPGSPRTVYASTSRGVFKSLDAGASWRSANVGLTADWVNEVAVDPQSPATLYAATSQGIFKSTDGGGSWKLVERTRVVDFRRR